MKQAPGSGDPAGQSLRWTPRAVPWSGTSVAVLFVVGIVGCADPDAVPGQGLEGFVQWDSAGVLISETPAVALETHLAWRVDRRPIVQLGEVEGYGPSQFHRIRGLTRRLTAGGEAELLVVDGGSQELRWFDGSGVHLRTLGGHGDGPGEFRSPILVPQFRPDSLLVFDTGARRFTWVALDGSGHRVVSMPSAGPQLFAGAASLAHGSRVLFRSAGADCLMEEYCEAPLSLRWVHLTEGVSDTIAAFVRRFVRSTEFGELPQIIVGPFDATAAVSPGPDGPVVGGVPDFEVRRFDATGDLAGILRVDAPVRPLDDEAMERVVRVHAGETVDLGVTRRVFQTMDQPDALPAFQTLVVDRLGWTWAELFRIDDDDPSHWLVFDPTGEAHGLVELPADLEVFEIGEDYVLGRWVDDLRVEYARLHRLERVGG